MDRPVNIIIAGGKTGGHLFPGIAVAQALKEQLNHVRILFVGTGTPFEVETLSQYGFPHLAIDSEGIKGKGVWQKITAVARIPRSVLQAMQIIISFKPDLVLGVGGYSSGPVLAGARLLGTWTAIQEQNALPGVTNRILSRMVHKIFISFKETRGLPRGADIVYTGNPIRKTASLPVVPTEKPRALPGEKLILLVTGGSQGATSINKAFMEAVTLLDDPLAYTIIHQTGRADLERVKARYRTMGVNATVQAFFHDMPEHQRSADIIICRAGAGTLSEITALGKPAILVPYPHAADDHQRYNAMALEKEGAAMMMADHDLNGKALAAAIEDLRKHPEKREKMALAAKALGMPHAGETVARELIHLIQKNR